MQPSSNDLEKLSDLIRSIRTAMLTTIDGDGGLHSRPMATQEAPVDGVIWFFTSASSGKAGEVEQEHAVNVSYSDASKNRFVSVSGLATLVHDDEKARELWSPIHKAWFPKGLEDPDLALLRVEIQRAEYWDGPNSKILQFYEMARALVTGKPFDERRTDHKKLEL